MIMSVFRSLFKKPRFPSNSVIYLAPHQDDELLSMGVDIIQSVSVGKKTHVYLFTDGSKSNMRLRICNGQSCPFHDGLHQYELTIPEFVAARDQEFTDSCLALGIQQEHIHIPSERLIDGSLSVEAAEEMIRRILTSHPKNVAVRTISPIVGSSQHSDHRNLGLAAMNLYRKGIIHDLRLFVEPYCLDAFKKNNPDYVLTETPADEETAKKLSLSKASYALWNPVHHRYAIGYHSVSRELDPFIAHPSSCYHIPDDISR